MEPRCVRVEIPNILKIKGNAFLARGLLCVVHQTCNELCTRIMELYFKDLETDDGAAEASMNCSGNEVADDLIDTAEEIAFAELAERVSAARLVY
jgi:hypothetical protein